MTDFLCSISEASMTTWLALVVLGFAVGFLTGFLGVGGGFIVAPILRVFFQIPYPIAVGSLVLQKIIASLVSSYRYARHENILWKTATLLIIGSIPGIGAGLVLMETLKDGPSITIFNREYPSMDLVITLLFVIILIYFATKMLRETKEQQSKKRFSLALLKEKLLPNNLPWFYDRDKKISYLTVISIGLVTGFSTAFLGISGVILVPLLARFLKFPIKQAIGTNLVYMFTGSLIAGGAHLLKGNFSLSIFLLLSVGAIIGAQLGSKFANLSNNSSIRIAFIVLLYITSIGIIVGFFNS